MDKAQAGLQSPKCRYCRHVSVIWTPAVASYVEWCGITSAVTRQVCERYEREPGSDDE